MHVHVSQLLHGIFSLKHTYPVNFQAPRNIIHISFVAHSTCSNYDYLCEASSVTGFEASIRSTPKSEARVITVGKYPMVALYKISKVTTITVMG